MRCNHECARFVKENGDFCMGAAPRPREIFRGQGPGKTTTFSDSDPGLWGLKPLTLGVLRLPCQKTWTTWRNPSSPPGRRFGTPKIVVSAPRLEVLVTPGYRGIWAALKSVGDWGAAERGSVWLPCRVLRPGRENPKSQSDRDTKHNQIEDGPYTRQRNESIHHKIRGDER